MRWQRVCRERFRFGPTGRVRCCPEVGHQLQLGIAQLHALQAHLTPASAKGPHMRMIRSRYGASRAATGQHGDAAFP